MPWSKCIFWLIIIKPVCQITVKKLSLQFLPKAGFYFSIPNVCAHEGEVKGCSHRQWSCEANDFYGVHILNLIRASNWCCISCWLRFTYIYTCNIYTCNIYTCNVLEQIQFLGSKRCHAGLLSFYAVKFFPQHKPKSLPVSACTSKLSPQHNLWPNNTILVVYFNLLVCWK